MCPKGMILLLNYLVRLGFFVSFSFWMDLLIFMFFQTSLLVCSTSISNINAVSQLLRGFDISVD